MLPHFAPGMPGQRDRMLLKGQALYPSAFVSEIGLLQAPLLRPLPLLSIIHCRFVVAG